MSSFVPSFRVEFSEQEIANSLIQVEKVLRSGRLTLGPMTESFEEEFARTVGIPHAIAVNSGSTALEIIFRILGVGGREVLVPSNTNFATAAAALYAGGEVSFFDGGLFPSLADIERRLSARTAAVVVVHIGGYVSAEMPRIRDLCKERGVWLVEDAAHAHHATLDGRQAGTLGDVAAFSFFPTKVLTTGEGGIIVSGDAELAEKARRYRDQGKDRSGNLHIFMGNSWRLTELGAAIGLSQLPSLERDTVFRQQIMDLYRRELGEVPWLSFPEISEGMRPSGYKCVALVGSAEERQRLEKALLAKGIQLGRPVYEIPLHRQPVFRQMASGPFPETDEFCDRHICLPLWRFIEEDQVRNVIETVKAIA